MLFFKTLMLYLKITRVVFCCFSPQSQEKNEIALQNEAYFSTINTNKDWYNVNENVKSFESWDFEHTVVSSGVSMWCFLGERRSSWFSSQLYLIRKMLKWPWGITRNESNCAQCLSINSSFQRAAAHGQTVITLLFWK